ncbi:MAG: HAD family hydrolase [Candidatus Hydrogenedentes bacterium]|nr:HAD family hydrolase [Candidatus Hydrogenedentota bacterium]
MQALIFDFDGLILDTETPDFQSWQEIYAAHGAELTMDIWADCVGRPAHVFDAHTHLEGLLGQALDRFEVRAQRWLRFAELLEAQSLLPGVESYVTEARRLGLRASVASSAPRSWVEHHLERLGLLAQFDCLRCVEDVTHAKPHPELYQSALTALGVEPIRAIAFEDSPNGAQAAKRAGLYCVAVPNAVTRQLLIDHADLVLNSLADLTLPELLSKVESEEGRLNPNSRSDTIPRIDE